MEIHQQKLELERIEEENILKKKLEEEKKSFEKIKEKKDKRKKFEEEAKEGEDSILIVLRLPEGQRLQRRFLYTDKIQVNSFYLPS